MKTGTLLLCGGTIGLLFGCATHNAVNPQMPANENINLIEESAGNIPSPSAPAAVNVSAKLKTIDNETRNCSIKGKPIMLNNIQIGITIHQGYCAPNLKPEGSKIWIPEAEAPAIGNIRIDDQCNITYCPTTAHYDHFGISNGQSTIQVQIRWQDNQPVIN
jgi:hypothetical protein